VSTDAGAVRSVENDAPRPGFLVVTSSPAGAEVSIDGVLHENRTPSGYSIASEQAHRVELRLEGHAPFARDDVTVGAQESLTLQVQLEPLRAALVVETEPSGVAVQLLERTLGLTPLRTDIALSELARVGPDAPLSLSKQGYRSESIEQLAHTPGEPIMVRRTLQRASRPAPDRADGKVLIHIDKTWANVYLGDRLVGRVPDELTLPVGRHRLRLHNPVTEQTWHLSVAVARNKPSYYRVPE
jgi:hypothetical protein